MIRHTMLTLAAAALLAASGGAPAEAHGNHRRAPRHVDSGFRVGGLAFDLGPDGFYLRVSRPLHTEVACSGFCYRDRGSLYHHRSCPAVTAHFERYRPGLFAAIFGPPVRKDRHDRRAYGRGYDDEYDDEWDDRPRRKSRRFAVRRHY